MMLRISNQPGTLPAFARRQRAGIKNHLHKIKDVLRLRPDAKLSHQQIATALSISKGVVTKYVGLAGAAGLNWPIVQELDEAARSGDCWQLRNSLAHVQSGYGAPAPGAAPQGQEGIAPTLDRAICRNVHARNPGKALGRELLL